MLGKHSVSELCSQSPSASVCCLLSGSVLLAAYFNIVMSSCPLTFCHYWCPFFSLAVYFFFFEAYSNI